MTIRRTVLVASAMLLISATGFAQVGPGLDITISDFIFFSAQVGVRYSSSLVAFKGTPPYTYSIVPDPDSLPPGLLLNPSSGAITGTPTTAGTYHFAGQVVDSSINTDPLPPATGPDRQSAARRRTLAQSGNHAAGAMAMVHVFIRVAPAAPSSTPVPPSVWMAMTGLAGAGLFRLRQKRRG